MRILFLGTSGFGVPTLKDLVSLGGHEVRVVTKEDSPAGRGRRLVAPPVKEAALDLGLDLLQLRSVNSPEAIDGTRSFSPHVILVASFAQKISEAFLDTAKHRGINIHPSLLPRYRGASPVPYAILNGDDTTGISIIRVAPRMDSGDILKQVEVPIDRHETAGDLLDRLSRAAPPLVNDVLDEIETGAVRATPQNEEGVVLAARLKKRDGLVDWGRSPQELDRFVRAMTPWPGAFTFLRAKGEKRATRLVLLDVAPEAVEERKPPGTFAVRQGRFVVFCGEGAVEIERVQKEGKKPIAGEEFLRGARFDPGSEVFCGPGEPEP